MRIGRETYASIAIEVMIKHDMDLIDIGCYGLLDEIFDQCVKRGVIRRDREILYKHPLDRQAFIMANLRRSAKFVRKGNISYPGIKGAARCALLEIKR